MVEVRCTTTCPLSSDRYGPDSTTDTPVGTVNDTSCPAPTALPVASLSCTVAVNCAPTSCALSGVTAQEERAAETAPVMNVTVAGLPR